VKFSQKRLSRPNLGSLLATRAGAVTLALLCAVVATGLLVFALSSYKHTTQAVIPQATVLIATGEIRQGTSGDAIAAERLYKSTPVAATQLSAGAISDSSVLAGKTTSAAILPGQQLTLADFATAPGVTGLLAPDQRAVSLTIDESHGDTDVLLAGERVDVYADFPVGGVPTEVLVVSDALVIKPASATPTSGAGKSIAGASLVLAVTASQAPEIGYALDHGIAYIAVRPPNASAPPVPFTTIGTIVAAAPAQTSATANSSTAATANTARTKP